MTGIGTTATGPGTKEDYGVVHIHCAFLKEPDDIDQVIAQSLQEFEQGIQGARSRSRSRGEHANGVRRGGSKKKVSGF